MKPKSDSNSYVLTSEGICMLARGYKAKRSKVLKSLTKNQEGAFGSITKARDDAIYSGMAITIASLLCLLPQVMSQYSQLERIVYLSCFFLLVVTGLCLMIYAYEVVIEPIRAELDNLKAVASASLINQMLQEYGIVAGDRLVAFKSLLCSASLHGGAYARELISDMISIVIGLMLAPIVSGISSLVLNIEAPLESRVVFAMSLALAFVLVVIGVVVCIRSHINRPSCEQILYEDFLIAEVNGQFSIDD